jgi:hypothetical protein
MPFALRRVRRHVARTDEVDPRAAADQPGATVSGELSLRRGAHFAAAVLAIMLSEQALMNAGVLVVAAGVGAASLSSGLTGFVFNVMLIVRAPLQLFQAIQTSILPHLTGLDARAHSGGGAHADAFRRAVAVTVCACGGFGLAVALGLLAIGPPVMGILLGHKGYHYGRLGLAVVGLGMGMHLIAGTLNQAALARGRASHAAGCWLTCAALFVAFELVDVIAARVTRVEVGYSGATALLCALLWTVYRAGPSSAQTAPAASASAA